LKRDFKAKASEKRGGLATGSAAPFDYETGEKTLESAERWRMTRRAALEFGAPSAFRR